MRVFYSIHLSGEEEQANLLSIGVAADNGLTAYGEANDYEVPKVQGTPKQNIVDNFLGNNGMNSLIESRKKTKGYIAPARRVIKFIQAFLDPYKTIELVGFSNYYEMSAMLRVVADDPDLFNKQFTIANYSVGFMDDYNYLIDEVATEFPKMNALRQAIFYRYAAQKYEEKRAETIRDNRNKS